MSYLMTPRISFVGRFLSDVSTRNNVPSNYRPSGPMRDLWNVGGGASFELLDCRVCEECGLAADDPALRYVASGAFDRPSAKMVDLDPDWQMASEIWGLRLRVANPSSGALAFEGAFEVSAFRDLWERQIANRENGQPRGARFVSVLRDLVWGPAAEASPLLSRLQAETEAGKLSVGLHQFGYFYNENLPRHRTGTVLLHVGPYHAGEPDTVLAHRRVTAARLPGQQRPFQLTGDIDFAVTGEGHLVADLGHALLVSDVDGTLADPTTLVSGLARLSLGIAPSPVPPPLTPVPSDDLQLLHHLPTAPGWYRATGGLVTVELPDVLAARVAARPLALFAELDDGSHLLLAAETGDGLFFRPDRYVARLDPGDSDSFTVYVRRWGQPAPGVEIHAVRVDPNSGQIDTSPGLSVGSSVTSDAQGIARFTLNASDPGNPRAANDIDGQIFLLRYGTRLNANGLPDLAGTGLGALDVMVAHVRGAFAVPESPEFHKDIEPFMAQYARLYPVMSQHLFDIADYNDLVRHRRAMLLAFSRDIGDPNYMPVTRDLSAAKLETLITWLGSETGDPANPLRRDPAAAGTRAALAASKPAASAIAETAPPNPKTGHLELPPRLPYASLPIAGQD